MSRTPSGPFANVSTQQKLFSQIFGALKVDAHGVRNLLSAIGVQDMSLEQINDSISDMTGSEFLELRDFLQVFKSHREAERDLEQAELLRIFASMDRMGRGYVSIAALQARMKLAESSEWNGLSSREWRELLTACPVNEEFPDRLNYFKLISSLVNSKSKPSDYIIPSSTTIDYKHTDQFSNHGGDFDEEWQYDDIDDSDYSSEDSHSGSSGSFTDSPLQHARSPNRP